jgi:hypothetical protein
MNEVWYIKQLNWIQIQLKASSLLKQALEQIKPGPQIGYKPLVKRLRILARRAYLSQPPVRGMLTSVRSYAVQSHLSFIKPIEDDNVWIDNLIIARREQQEL